MNDDYNNRMVEAAHQRIDKLERLIKNSNNAPTIPSYDQFNFPQDAVYGQIAKDYNDHTMWVYGEDDAWHPVGGGRVGAAAKLTYNGFTDTSLLIPPSTTVTATFYRGGYTDGRALAFAPVGSFTPSNTGPWSSIRCNPGDWFSAGDNSGIYTFFFTVHLYSGVGVSDIETIIVNPSDLFNHNNFIPINGNGGSIQGGVATHEDFAQLYCGSGEGKGVTCKIRNNNSSFTAFIGWYDLTAMYQPTLDTFSNPDGWDPNSVLG